MPAPAALTRWQDVALAYCPYTQGPVPYWFLVDEFAPLLLPRERAVARALGQEAEAAIGAQERARVRAINRVLQSGTTCAIQTSRASGAEVAVALIQQVPVLVEPTSDLRLTGLSDEEQEARWIAALSAASRETQERRFALRLVQLDGEGWGVDAQLDTRFAAPLRAERAFRKVEDAVRDRGWAEAAAIIEEACSEPAAQGWCPDMRRTVQAGARAALDSAASRSAIELSEASVTGLVLSSQRTVSVLAVHVRYSGLPGLRTVWAEVEQAGGAPLVCMLDKARPPARQGALLLTSGDEADGYCVLRGEPSSPVVVRVRDVEVIDSDANQAPVLGTAPLSP